VNASVLGSLGEVDDAVQEAWLRLSRTDATGIDNLGGWLTTVVARVCLDMLRSRQARREDPITPDAPERSESRDPEQEATGDFEGLLAVLDPDLVVRADMPGAPPSEIRGAAVWAKGAVTYGHLARLTTPALVNGTVGVVVAPRGRLVRALRFTIADGKITEIDVIGNPERLGELEVSIVD
jgi:Sigma-70 region 2